MAKEGREQSDISLEELLLAVKQSTMRDTHVASFGIVKKVDDFCQVQTFPTLTDEPLTTTTVFNGFGELEVGDVVLIVYTDRSFMQNIKQLKKGLKMTNADNDNILHSKDFGVIIAKINLGGNNNASD